jgi:site-specific recombinase XerD
VLSSEEATALLEDMDVSTVVGLRDRAIVAVMAYTFARVGVVVPLERRGLLHEKNGKLNCPCRDLRRAISCRSRAATVLEGCARKI